MTAAKTLVLGASGFLGSHVTRRLVEAGREVRILVRKSSDMRATDGLQVEIFHGDVLDAESLAQAMQGCDRLFYCVVDTRAWLRDPAPLYRVNVDGLRNAMDAALAANIQRFVFTSTYGTIGINPSGVATEQDKFNWWDEAPDYIRCRVEAENLFIEYCRDEGLPGVACCVGNTYGDGDYAPTPHGQLLADVARSKMPVYWDGGGPVVGIRDAADAMLLAEEKGGVGERYIIAERWMDYGELFQLAADAAGVKPPAIKIPTALMYAVSGISDVLSRIRGRDSKISIASLKCSRMLPNVESSKAQSELGWQPRPTERSIEEAVAFYLSH
ncbi:MAG: NAD-dependent epimerase/dehydratase family protein [Pseudomonadales bacterium]